MPRKANRWHLIQNLSRAVEHACRRHRTCLRPPAVAETGPHPVVPEIALLDRVRQRYGDVNDLAATGLSLSAIGRRLQLDCKTVRRYRESNLDSILASARDRGQGVLDPFLDYVQHRFKAGQTNSMQLYRELLTLGYTGGYHVVNHYVAAIRTDTAVPARAVAPGPRTITSWIMRPHETLSSEPLAALDEVRLACPDITADCDFARVFTDLVRHRRGHLLLKWIKQAERDGPPPIRGFAGYPHQDLDAEASDVRPGRARVLLQP